MLHKIFTALLTVLIAVSSLSAYALVLGDCPDSACCCCQGAAMAGKMETGQTDNDTKIQTANKCCCEDADGKTCSLTTVTPLEQIGWALLSHRFDPSFDTLSGITSIDDGRNDSDLILHRAAMPDVVHPGSPPIYLSAMSFLC